MTDYLLVLRLPSSGKKLVSKAHRGSGRTIGHTMSFPGDSSCPYVFTVVTGVHDYAESKGGSGVALHLRLLEHDQPRGQKRNAEELEARTVNALLAHESWNVFEPDYFDHLLPPSWR